MQYLEYVKLIFYGFMLVSDLTKEYKPLFY
jgi:hypothetical protein